jgi:hypothetical protein
VSHLTPREVDLLIVVVVKHAELRQVLDNLGKIATSTLYYTSLQITDRSLAYRRVDKRLLLQYTSRHYLPNAEERRSALYILAFYPKSSAYILYT